ncbi:MAG: 2-oxo acid dehydrogenase subunit E2 [Bacteroidales bacterium]|nr:2-oxo acid dehydrogenase subunit E2 [Bacteroidales bacterium]
MKTSKELTTNWRKVASTIYKKPVDSKIFGEVEIDVTHLENFISEQRRKGLKVTMTHVFLLIMARGLRTEAPELNAFFRRGRIVPRPSIDAAVSILQADGGMGSVLVHHADQLNLEQAVEVLGEGIQSSRRSDEKGLNQKKNILTAVPWPFRNWVFKLYTTLTFKWGLSLPFLGTSPNSFGSFVLTNIGSIGLDKGFPALMPSSNVSFVLVMGGVSKKPWVVNDEIVIRRIMSLTTVIDHRIADASHGGKMFRYVKHILQHPEELL